MKSIRNMTNTFFVALFILLVMMAGNPVFAQSGTWETKARMPTARSGATGGVINGELYVAGGQGTGNQKLTTLEVYNPATNTWTTKASMPTARNSVGSGVINGELYVIGGQGAGEQKLSTLEVYNPTTNTWTTKAPMPTKRSGPGVVAIGDKLYVAGGCVGWCAPVTNVLEVYDSVTNTWTTKAPLPTGRGVADVAAVNGLLYVMGGCCGAVGSQSLLMAKTIEVYNPTDNTWTAKAQHSVGSGGTAGSINGKIYVAESPAAELYDPATDAWASLASMPIAPQNAAGGVIDGALYVAGGGDSSSSALNTLEVYTPALMGTALKGDVNGDGHVNIGDAILALKVVAETASSGSAYKQADVNGDQRIGAAEAIYILQNVVGLRIAANGELNISSLSGTSAPPAALLTISGSGFDPTAALSVRFFDEKGFTVTLPAIKVNATAVYIIIPPFINMTTKVVESGVVNVEVMQTSGTAVLMSNTISGFRIDPLPTLTLPPGSVTANVAGFLELALTGTETRLSELDTSSGGTINTVDLRAKLESIRLQYGQLKGKIRNAIANPGQAETIGAINGVPVKLDQESLRIADQMMAAMINEILAEMQYRIAQSASLPHERSLLATSAGSSMNLKEYCAVTVCTDSGYPLDYMEMYGSGESVSYSYYKSKILLPEFSARVSKVAQWFADAAGAVGTGLAIVGAGIPTLAAAAITEVIVLGMVAQQGIDAAAYTANPTKENAKQIADDLNDTFSYFSKSVLSPVIGYMSEKSGIIFDLSDYWYPVVEAKIPVFITQVKTFIDQVVPPTCTFFTYSAWSACQPGNTQTRTVISSTPAGCTGGMPILSQSCTSQEGLAGSWSGTYNLTITDGCTWHHGGAMDTAITVSGNNATGIVTMTGIKTLRDDTCAEIESNTFDWSLMGIITGATVTGNIDEIAFAGTFNGSSFSGELTCSGGSGTFSLSKN